MAEVKSTSDLAKEWQGKWDVIITYDIPDADDVNDKDEVEKETRRKKLIHRMRKCGLIVVKQKSLDGDFMMLKVTADPTILEYEANRMQIDLPLKKENTQTLANEEVRSFRDWVLHVFFNQKVESCYANYGTERKHIFSVNDERFFRSMDRQRLIMSIVSSPAWHGGCNIDIKREIKHGVFSDVFPVHTRGGQIRMVKQWLDRPLWKLTQPLDDIRDYFGEKVAFYFAYISEYTQWLVPLSLAGVICFIISWVGDGDPSDLELDNDVIIFYAIFICLWSSLFIEAWKRQQSSIAFRFNVTDFATSTEARPAFRGKVVKGRVTEFGLIDYAKIPEITPEMYEKIDETVVWYSPTKRYVRYCLGAPIISSFAVTVIIGTFALLAFKTFLENDGVTGGGIIGSIVNAIFIIVMNVVYQKVAILLNRFENHRTEHEYENALIAKTFIFQFINSYITMFFIAFVKNPPLPNFAQTFHNGTSIPNEELPQKFGQAARVIGFDIGACNASTCMQDLFAQLATLVIVKQLLSNLAEVGVPWLKGKLVFLLRARDIAKSAAQSMRGHSNTDGESIATKAELERITFYEEQCSLSVPQPIFYEFNELMIQYGYMTMFATAFPLASLFALVNNMLEIRVDGLKIVFATKRPHYEGAADIGTWLKVLQFMSIISVMTNSAIICFTSEALKGSTVDRTSAKYSSCLLTCETFINATVNNFTTWSSNTSDPDLWLFAGAAEDSISDTRTCFEDCSCTGRCLSLAARFLIFVLAEHFILALRIALDAFIPDVPKKIARALAWRDLLADQLHKELILDNDDVHVLPEWDIKKDPEDKDAFMDTEDQDPQQKVTIKTSLVGGVKVIAYDGQVLTADKGRARQLSTLGEDAKHSLKDIHEEQL